MNAFGTVATLGLFQLFIMQDAIKENEALAKKEKEAIEKIRKGESSVFVSSGNPYVPSYEYVRETGAEEVVSSQAKNKKDVIGAAQTAVKLEPLAGGPAVAATTNGDGWAELFLARNTNEAAALKPGTLRILALWDNRWQVVGTTELDGPKIAQVIARVARPGESPPPPPAAKTPPLIAIAAPMDGAKFAVPAVTVSGSIADDREVRRVEYRLNGRPLPAQEARTVGRRPAEPQNPSREISFSFSAALAEGKNEIEVLAWDDEGLQARKTLAVFYEKSKSGVFLVSIGLNKYQSNQICGLQYAVKDAQDVAECLRRRLGIPQKNLWVLTDAAATRQKILHVLGVELKEAAGAEDTVILFFSGHGVCEPDNRAADSDGLAKYFATFDTDPDSLYSTALPMDQVRDIFSRLNSRRVVFLVDACYSGEAGGKTFLPPKSTGLKSPANPETLWTRLRDAGSGRAILTASRGWQLAREKPELNHGIFTYYLLQGLEGQADVDRNGEVTVQELYEYVYREVPKATGQAQQPMYFLSEGCGQIILSFIR